MPMKDMNIEEIGGQYYDVLKELGNIGAGNATTALAQMLDARVDMSVPKVSLLEFKDLGEVVGGEDQIMVAIYLRVEGDVEGSIMFMLSKPAAAHLANKLMGGMLGITADNAADHEFGEMECSAIMEVGNIITGSYLNALSGLTSMKMYPSVPHIGIDMAGALLSVPAIEFGVYGDHILMIQTKFSDDIDLDGFFLLIPDMESYEKILASLGVM